MVRDIETLGDAADKHGLEHLWVHNCSRRQVLCVTPGGRAEHIVTPIKRAQNDATRSSPTTAATHHRNSCCL